MKKNIVLITILAALVAIKFILVPIFTWQNDEVEQTNQLQRKIQKSADYIERLPELVAQKEKLTAVITAYQQQNDTFNDIGRYKLNKQRELEALFVKHNITIKTLNWRDQVSTEQGISLPIHIQFTGQLKSFINLKLAIVTLGGNIELDKFSVNIVGQVAKNLGRVTGNLVIVFSPTESADAID